MKRSEVRQILKNQRDIMRWIGTGDVNTNFFSQRVKETTALLDSEENNEGGEVCGSCGHDLSFHDPELNCISGLVLDQKGIISRGCGCKNFKNKGEER